MYLLTNKKGFIQSTLKINLSFQLNFYEQYFIIIHFF